MSRWVVDGLAIAIVGIWIVTCVVTIVHPSYTPPSSVQWCISILAGGAFGYQAARESKNGRKS